MPTSARRRYLRRGSALALALALAVLGVWGYRVDQDSRDQALTVVGATGPDRVDVHATVQKVDPVAREATVRLRIVPRGALAEPDRPGVPEQALTLYTSSPTQSSITLAAGTPPPQQSITLGLDSGTVTDYPRDDYTLLAAFGVDAAQRAVPVELTVDSADAFFVLAAPRADYTHDATELQLTARRSSGGLILAWFLMLVAWALALVVAGAAAVLVGDRRGLVWPALGWMAATLFALVTLRNNAPGQPPIGSLIDYAAYFWAEFIVAAALVTTATAGILAERPRRRTEAELPAGQESP